MKKLEWTKNEFFISTERELLQIEVILEYLINQSYWAQNRTPEQMKTAIKNSLCFGVYLDEKQIGFARVVTDFSTFAYLGDVFILPAFQGKELGKWLMETISNHPDLQNFRRWILATKDAHKLYQRFGFSELKHPESWMEKAAPNAY